MVGGGGWRPPLAGRRLLSVGVMQLLLGLCTVALCCGALSISTSQPVRKACPFWAGSSVVLSGIVGLTTWRRPLLLLVNVFVVLSVMCVILNLAAFIQCCQGAQLVSSMNTCTLSETGDACHCCSLSPTSECPEDKLLLLSPGSSCSTMRMLLKKVLFALSALNALSTAVCLVAAALRYLQIFNTRPPCMTEESRVTVEDGMGPDVLPDPDEFVAPAPPPSYFSMFYSYTPRLARRMFGDSVVPHVSGARMKGAELFPPLDPPPPYEEVAGSSAPNTTVTQETELSTITCNTPVRGPVSDARLHSVSGGSLLPPSPPKRQAGPGQQQAGGSLSSQRAPRRRRSNSDPLLTELTTKVLPPDGPHRGRVTTDSATQTSQPALAGGGPSSQLPPSLPRWRPLEGNEGSGGVRSARLRPRRPSSMVDHQSYQHTQQLVSRFLEQPRHQGLDPEVHRLVDSIRTVLQLDQQHMEEVVRSASYIEQAFTEAETGGPGGRARQPITRHHTPPPPPPPLQQPSSSSQTPSGSARLRPRRPSSMVDHQSYQHTQQLVSRFLEQPRHQGLDPEVHRLVDSIRTVLQLDQQHMEEVVRSASYIEQHLTHRGNEGSGGVRSARLRPRRPSSMVDHQSYQHTQQLVSRFLEQPRAQGLDPEVHRLVDSIRTVLQLDQQHMEEVVRSASYIEQAFTESEMMGGPSHARQPIAGHHSRAAPPPQPSRSSQTLPLPPRKRPGLLHLRSCGDLSSFTCPAVPAPERRAPRAPPRATGAAWSSSRPSEWRAAPGATLRSGSRREPRDRPHSLIGIFRETIL